MGDSYRQPGFPMGKDKTVIADLSGKFLSEDHRIRIRTNMEIYWDQIFFSEIYLLLLSIIRRVLNPVMLTFITGVSLSIQKRGRYGPHWFDYSEVEKTEMEGSDGKLYPVGDVLPLLSESDNKYIISNAGDETTLNFNATGITSIEKGWKRDFLIHSVGWVKDGDINTAFGNTVLPLPFHGMKSYPPSKRILIRIILNFRNITGNIIQEL